MSAFLFCFMLFIDSVSSNNCGWYDPTSNNITSPMIPIGICANWGALPALDKSEKYECDNDGRLTKKIYDGYNCNHLLLEEKIDSGDYSCNQGKCYGHLVLETYSRCFDFSSGQTNQCKCLNSQVTIINTNVCIATNTGSYIVLCNQVKVTYKYYLDQQCKETDEIRELPQGCIEQDAVQYIIHLCKGAATEKCIQSVLIIVFINLFLR